MTTSYISHGRNHAEVVLKVTVSTSLATANDWIARLSTHGNAIAHRYAVMIPPSVLVVLDVHQTTVNVVEVGVDAIAATAVMFGKLVWSLAPYIWILSPMASPCGVLVVTVAVVLPLLVAEVI